MPPPYTPMATPSNGHGLGFWYGAPSSAWSYGAANIGRSTREGPAVHHYTVIPLPAQPIDELTMQARADAIASTYSGLLMQAVDLYRLTVERNGFMAGILWTMGHGFLRLPIEWKGDPEMIAALTDIRDADGRVLSPGDWSRMHPENEVAKIVSDGIGIGLGLGQYLLMCWRCDGVEWLRQAGATDAHVEVECCKRCGARRLDRPIGVRELYQLRWRDPRWLWRNTVTGQWWYTGRQGMIAIEPGDGEWFFFQTVPDQDMWIHGPWHIGTEAAIFTRDGRYDLQAISATCGPTHVFQFSSTSGSDPRVRENVDLQADNLRFQNKLTLPGEVTHEIHAATGGDGGYVGTADRITKWSQAQWEMVVTGIQAGTEQGPGFANNDVLQRVSRERRGFYAGALVRQLTTQGLKWWANDNFSGRACPVGEIDTRSPEEKLAKSKADEQEGKALAALRDGYNAVGFQMTPSYLVERAQREGIRIEPSSGFGARQLTWDPATLSSFVTVAQALADQGLPALPPGDPRAAMMVAVAGSPPSGGAAPPEAAPALGAPPIAQPLPAEPAARSEEEEDCIDDCEDECARLAAEYTAARLDRCPFHGRTHACPRCGVRRVYGLDPATGEPRIAWRAIKAPRPAPAPSAA